MAILNLDKLKAVKKYRIPIDCGRNHLHSRRLALGNTCNLVAFRYNPNVNFVNVAQATARKLVKVIAAFSSSSHAF